MIFRREIGWCVAQAYRLVGARWRARARCRQPGMILPIVFHAAEPDEVRGVLSALKGIPLEVTFDDGWRQLLPTLSVLEEFNQPATVFIAPGETERGVVWTNALMNAGVPDDEWHPWYALAADSRYEKCDTHPRGPRQLLTSDEVQELARHPLIRVGNHTWSHLSCTHRPVTEVLDEIDRAQETLTKWCGSAPTAFAYPFGRGTPELDAAIRSRGLTPYYTRQGLVTEATRGAARNMVYESMTLAENVGRVLQAWPKVGETR